MGCKSGVFAQLPGVVEIDLRAGLISGTGGCAQSVGMAVVCTGEPSSTGVQTSTQYRVDMPLPLVFCGWYDCEDHGGSDKESDKPSAEVQMSSDAGGTTDPPPPPDDGRSGEGKPVVNDKGDPYPTVIDPRTRKPIPFPQEKLTWIPEPNREVWDNTTRAAFIKEWYDKGYGNLPKSWREYDIHHILPREYGGTNDFWNLVPVERDTYTKIVTPWWNAFTPP
jgi:hypothetical protein